MTYIESKYGSFQHPLLDQRFPTTTFGTKGAPRKKTALKVKTWIILQIRKLLLYFSVLKVDAPQTLKG